MLSLPRNLLLALGLSTLASATTIYESSRHDIAVGNFGVAWLNGGDVMHSNGINTTGPLLAGLNATKVIGADVTGDGQQEVVFVAGGGLYYYDFTTQAASGPFGSSINEITAGKFLTAATRDTVMVSNGAGSTGQLFAFDGATNSFTALGGSGIRSMARGNFNPANTVDEFVVINTSNQPYLYTPNGTGGGAFTGPVGGADYRAAVGGDLSAVAGDEFWLLYSAGYTVYYTENPAGTQNNVNTNGAGTAQLAVGIGNLDGGIAEGYVLGAGASNVLYRWRNGTGFDVFPAGNTGWATFIAGNFDGDSADELFAVKANEPGVLYRYDPGRGDATFTLIVQPNGDGPSAAQLGNDANGAPTLDGWRAILIVNESDAYTNNSGVPEQVTLTDFNVQIGAVRGRVTPFVVRVLGDNAFTVLAIGTTRVTGVDYTTTGPKTYPFAAAPFVFTLNPGEKIAMGYTDANANGTGNDGSVVPFTDGGDQIWLTGGPNSNQAGSVAVGSAPAAGVGGTTYTTLTRGYACNVATTIVPLANVKPRNILLSNTEIPAGAPAGTTVGTLSTDDRNPGDTHTYILVTNPGGAFVLAGNTLSLGSAAGPAGTNYTVRIRSTDNGGLALEKDLGLTVVAPQPPTAIATTADYVLQGTAIGTTLGAFTTTDPNPADTHTYSLVAGPGADHNALFSINGSSLVLAQPVPAGATTLNYRVRATDNGGLFMETAFTLAVLPGGVRINEFSAINETGIQDEDGAREDWIELYNPAGTPVNLAGWRLTDDPEDSSKWVFPSRTIPAGGYLVVFASSKDRKPATGNLHTNFQLDGDGEYLALYRADGVLADGFQPREQSTDLTYGWAGGGAGRGYFAPTPGSANGTVFPYGLNNITYSVQRGFYTTPQSLTLTPSIPGSIIRYTMDGTKPTAANGTVYGGPIAIAPETTGQRRGTRRVRAVALHPGAAAAKTKTHTYLFVNGVASPASDGIVGQTNTNNQPQTDAIKANATYAALLDDALLALPCIVITNPSGLPATSESETSVELIDPNGTESGFQVNCGIQAVGNASLSSPKNNFRLYFRAQYGDTKLRYNLFAGHPYDAHGATDTFDRLNIRSCSHDTFHWLADPGLPPSPGTHADALYLRNILMDDLQFAMGKMSTHGRYVNCIVNGQFHGLYHIREYPNDDFIASYLPGGTAQFEFTNGANAGENGSGNWQAVWNTIRTYATSAGAANYTELKRRLNVQDLADFVVLNFWAGNNWDWNPNQNWMAAGPNIPDAGGWRFFSYDNDIIWMSENANVVNRNVPDSWFNSLMATHADFQQLVRDRAYKHLFHEGVLTSAKARAVMEFRENQIRIPLVAETARWQPGAATSLPWDRDGEWQTELNRMKNTFFPNRPGIVINQLKAQGWYPVDAPEFAVHGGNVAAGYQPVITGPAGTTIHATTDGSDPRLSGGAISGTALVFTPGAITINAPTVVRIRARNASGQWSPLNEVTYTLTGTVPASAANIAISEIHYHPAIGGQEFIELINVGAAPADLSGARFANGLDYVFPSNTILAPGARIVVTESQFLNGSNLSNAGERITLVASDGTTVIRDFTYSDSAPWPVAPDGGGPSLVLKNPAASDTYHGGLANWRSSVAPGGSPGAGDATSFAGVPGADADGDGLTALLEYALHTSDADAAQGPGAWTFTRDTAVPGSFLFTFQRALATDDLNYAVETSAELVNWSPAHAVLVSQNDLGATATVTYRVTAPAGATRIFVRLKVVRP